MNTIENNKLIGEFMEVKFKDDELYLNELRAMKANGIYFEQGYMLSELQYHTSWEWLMPVVRKIERTVRWLEISCNEDEDAFLSDEYTSILETVPLAIIEDAYKAVVEFIKWYNDQNKFVCGSCGEMVNSVKYNGETETDECENCMV